MEFPPRVKLDPSRERPYNYSMEDMLRLAEIELEEMFVTDLSETEETNKEEEAK